MTNPFSGSVLVYGGAAKPQLARVGCYRACKNAGKWALKMAGLRLIGEDGPRGFWGSWEGSESELATIASPWNGGSVMTGRETRVLLRHYLEQGLSKAAVARRAGVA